MVADVVELERHAGQAERVVEAGQQIDDLCVDQRVAVADRLDAELRVLAKAAGLGAVVAEDRRDVEETHRLGERPHAVFQICPADVGRPLRPERQPVAAPVFEDVHLLFDHVRAGARASEKEVRILKHRRLDAPVAEAPADALARLQHKAPIGLVLGEQILRATRDLKALLACRFAHRDASIAEEALASKGSGVVSTGERLSTAARMGSSAHLC